MAERIRHTHVTRDIKGRYGECPACDRIINRPHDPLCFEDSPGFPHDPLCFENSLGFPHDGECECWCHGSQSTIPGTDEFDAWEWT